ncbi:MAG: SsrA-binding protein SmpB [Paludibacteraceae bacterium]|jgi:SsrA-binding protein|nr:SsrA-binding protein SmpB [Paludibacteraceae bacterium]MBO5864399.1 SsrA-binding protein SmpB [Paludibacteraceae bacterium]MBO5989298.1 SsrA-binding protein SmpB [Paludibacteraceae bacterium]MEE0997183.1 SsrA-binding protein SmpB [Paludibacteraceae bacterium]MEE1541166.1 SsrA-binding protein SmpB [Paludibacteraceae bacterium]
MSKIKNDILIRNKRASFDYELLDKFQAGIVLVGTEIKSIRNSKASLVDSFCFFANDELWVKNMNISEYFFGSYNNHAPKRDRKLLLTKRELQKIRRMTKETGFTIVPTKLFISEKGLAKLEIAVAKGKKEYDKRESLKEKDDKRTMERFMKR